MNRLFLTILGLLVMASAWFGLAQLSEVRRLRQSIAAWDAERATLQKRIWELQKQNSALENRRIARANVAGAMAGDGGPGGENASGPDNGTRLRARGEGGRFAAMMATPEVQKLMAVQQKAALDGRYSALFKQLQLNPADLEKFKNLLVEKQTAVMDVVTAARQEGLTGRDDRDQVRQLVQDAQTEVDNTIRSTLGDAAYAQYQGYEATQPQRNVVSQLEQRLSYSAAPLSDTQSQQMVQILANTSPAPANTGTNVARVAMGGGGGPGGGFGGGGVPITDDAINQAQSILSAQQVSALQGLQQEQQASAQLRQQMRASIQGQTAGAPATGTSGPAPQSSHPSS